jgi:hypothetical protein
MNGIHITPGIVIAIVALWLVSTKMSEQRSSFAHKNHCYHYIHRGDSAARAAACNSGAASASRQCLRGKIRMTRTPITTFYLKK